MFLKLFNGLLLPFVKSPLFLILSLSLLAMTRKKKVTYPNPIPNAPRGVRNNNPGNLKISPSLWKGKISSSDPPFEQFSDMSWGARAQMKNIQTWYRRGANTIRKLITIWAPASDNNDTEAYIRFVSSQMNISPDYQFALSPTLLQELAFAMSIMENGRTSYITRDLYTKAYELL